MQPQESIFPERTHPAPEYNPKKQGILVAIKEWIQVVVVALAIALPVRYFVAEPFIVNGASMDPTFSTGQFLIVDRITYRFDQPERGDVVVFKYPLNPNTYYIKRIIGLPAETVTIKKGKVTITSTEFPAGKLLDESYLDEAHASMDTFTMTLGSAEYFVMGDNRSESSDSRVWGPLEKKFIVGRPIFRLLPVGAIAVLPGKQQE